MTLCHHLHVPAELLGRVLDHLLEETIGEGVQKQIGRQPECSGRGGNHRPSRVSEYRTECHLCKNQQPMIRRHLPVDPADTVDHSSPCAHRLQRAVATRVPGREGGRQQGYRHHHNANHNQALSFDGGINDATEPRHGIHGLDVGAEIQPIATEIAGHRQPKYQPQQVAETGQNRCFEKHQPDDATAGCAQRHHYTEFAATLQYRHQNGVNDTGRHHHKHHEDHDVGDGVVKGNHLHQRWHQRRPAQHFHVSIAQLIPDSTDHLVEPVSILHAGRDLGKPPLKGIQRLSGRQGHLGHEAINTLDTGLEYAHHFEPVGANRAVRRLHHQYQLVARGDIQGTGGIDANKNFIAAFQVATTDNRPVKPGDP